MSSLSWKHHVRSINPTAEKLFKSRTREEFLDAAEDVIARVVQRMESSRATFRKLDERDLSNLIVQMLGDLVPAEAESHQNGHVDVTIRHRLGFVHLTECKIWNGTRWHEEGMRQLLRYATGREGRTLCLAFFIRHKRMVYLLDRLRAQLGPAADPPALGLAVDHRILPGAFLTLHEHASGSRLGIVHAGCYLWEEGIEDLGEGDYGGKETSN